MKRNHLLLAGILTTAIAGSVLIAGTVSASPNDMGSFVEKFAARFNLNADEVQAFVNEERSTRQEQRQLYRDEHLQSLVDNGTLTTEQRDTLVTRLDALHSTRDELREQGLSRDEMHEKMEELRSELEQWAESEGIDLDAMRPSHRHGSRGSFHAQDNE